MSESKPATQNAVVWCFVLLLLWLTIEHWTYWRPTWQAVQRIEQKIDSRCGAGTR